MVKIICVGKIKELYLKNGIDEYLKRLNPFDKIEIIEVKEVTNKDLKSNVQAEGDLIFNQIDASDYVITLEIKGKILNSEELAKLIDEKRTYDSRKMTFIIGGSNGLSPIILKRSDFALSFSRLTFPHQLMRLILLEQIYRAFTILNNQEYHK